MSTIPIDPAGLPGSQVVGRRRPIGWSPGTGILIGAWFVGAAIARLTGAAAVILVLAGVLVGFVFDGVAGWRAARRPGRVLVHGPAVTTVGEQVHLTLTFDDDSRRGSRPANPGPSRDRRFVLRSPDGHTVTSVDVSSRIPAVSAPGSFTTPGVVGQLAVAVETTGPIGLVWWRRRHVVTVAPIHVAPVAAGDVLTVDRSPASLTGSTTAGAGGHTGDIDGVRAWRRGDAIGSVHWPSSLRADELIVHDRVAAGEEHWLVHLDADALDGDALDDDALDDDALDDDALDGDALDGARLRRTLDEGLRLGHTVAVCTADGEIHSIRNDDDAARWSAVVSGTGQERLGSRPAPGARRSALVGALRTPVRITRPELGRVDPLARWSAGAAALAGLAMLVGALDVSPTVLALIATAVVAGVVVSLRVAARRGTRPLAMQIAVGTAVFAALVAIAVDAADVDGLLAALRGPLPNLLMLLVVLHGFEVVDRRTLRAHQAIGLVVAMYAAGLRIDAALGWWLAVWATAFAVSMLTTTRRPVPPSGHPATARTGWSTLGGIRVLAWAAAFAVATLAVLGVVPVPDGPARLGLPALSNGAPAAAQPGSLVGADGSPTPPTAGEAVDRASLGGVVGYPGFTDTLDTSIRGALGDDIVMRVRAPEPAFWRGQTFSDFDGRTWTASGDIGTSADGPVIDVRATVGDALGSSLPSEQLVQTYFVEQDLPNLVFAAYRPTQVIFDGTVWTRPDGALRSDVTLTAGSVYTVVSDRLQVTAETLRAQGDVGALFEDFMVVGGAKEVAPFLQLPESTTPRTIELATALRAPGGSTYDTILAYQRWLAANTAYDLDAPVPAAGVDAVDDFLFGSRRGFCEQIATALTIMLRSQGVPARLATGYVPGERDRVSGVWTVRGSDAHAWVEVWFPQSGWEAFDPTASVPLAGDADAGTVGGDLIAAAASSIVSHRLEISGAVVALAAAWSAVMLLSRVRRRRHRGRWGLLQDRFTALAPRPLTNPAIARELGHRVRDLDADAAVSATVEADADVGADIDAVAAILDRAAFDPSWTDDDRAYERTRAAVTTLERRIR